MVVDYIEGLMLECRGGDIASKRVSYVRPPSLSQTYARRFQKGLIM